MAMSGCDPAPQPSLDGVLSHVAALCLDYAGWTRAMDAFEGAEPEGVSRGMSFLSLVVPGFTVREEAKASIPQQPPQRTPLIKQHT